MSVVGWAALPKPLDALSDLYEKREAWPELRETGPVAIEAEQLAHPMLPADRRISDTRHTCPHWRRLLRGWG